MFFRIFFSFFLRICITRTKTYFPANCVRAKLILGVNILHSWRLHLQLNIKNVNAGRKLIFRKGAILEICISFLHIWLHDVLNCIVRLNDNTVKIQNHVICLFNGVKNFVLKKFFFSSEQRSTNFKSISFHMFGRKKCYKNVRLLLSSITYRCSSTNANVAVFRSNWKPVPSSKYQIIVR